MMNKKKRSHLNERWYVVGQPWGRGDFVIAGHNDPHTGIFVCDCQNWDLDVDIEIYSNKWDAATPQKIAQRIANDHNEVLALRKQVAELEGQLEVQKTARQQINELYG